MSTPSPFQQALREQLMAAARRPAPRRRWPWVTAAVSAVGAAIVGAVAFLGTSPAAADIHVTIEDGRVEILLTDLESTPEEVAAAVEAAGLDVRVETLAAGPSNVGRFVLVRVDGGGETPPIERVEEGVSSFMGFSLLEGWDGTLVISLGRPAEQGEVYTIPSDAFAADEPLYCVELLGRTLAAGADELDDLTVRIQPLADGRLTPPVALSDTSLRDYGAWVVTRGLAESPSAVLLQLQPPGTAPPEPSEPGC